MKTSRVFIRLGLVERLLICALVVGLIWFTLFAVIG